jgi:hypothetical protein
VAAGDVMTGSMIALVGDYIQLRRGLGYRSPSQERALRALARYLDGQAHDGPIPLESSLDWATTTRSSDPCNPARRLTVVRGFLRHLAALDGATEVPAPGLLGPTGHRRPPHVYSDGEIAEHHRGPLRSLHRTHPGRRAVRAPRIGFPQLVQDYFLRRLVQQRGASARTVESYRDAFELLFGFVEQRVGKSPSALEMADLDAPLVLDFLPRDRARQHHADPQRPACRDPLVHAVRRGPRPGFAAPLQVPRSGAARIAATWSRVR